MMWLLLLLSIFTIIFSYLLFAPFYLEANSTVNRLRLRFHKIATAEIQMANRTLFLKIKVAGWKKKIDLLAPTTKKEKTEVKKRKTSKSKYFSFSKLKSIINSFKINTCYINLDFENVRWNAALFPVFYGLSRVSKKQFHINFVGQNQINLQIENTMARIIWAYLFNK
ncbi:hypothetical protein [Pedobacter cryophilus]|uniref:DUF2953 domain-containing protein n=1 Tax=Pedobacter cryophilus TaxID=2571271 RepID=A0A4U1BWW9_9SPHI|nr:hypothetical protein [Pedobacter cryophilus]TKB96821.1 hypothetical protein FA046_12110 [Pedobacter cryophilus]